METFSSLLLLTSLVVSSFVYDVSSADLPYAVGIVRCWYNMSVMADDIPPSQADLNCQITDYDYLFLSFCDDTRCCLRVTSIEWFKMPDNSFGLSARALNTTDGTLNNSPGVCTMVFDKPQEVILNVSLFCNPLKSDRLSVNVTSLSTNDNMNVPDVTPARRNQSTTLSGTNSVELKRVESSFPARLDSHQNNTSTEIKSGPNSTTTNSLEPQTFNTSTLSAEEKRTMKELNMRISLGLFWIFCMVSMIVVLCIGVWMCDLINKRGYRRIRNGPYPSYFENLPLVSLPPL